MVSSHWKPLPSPMKVSQKPLILPSSQNSIIALVWQSPYFTRSSLGSGWGTVKTEKVITFFEQREFNALEVSLVAFFIHQPRSVNIDSVIKKTKVWFSFPAPKAECMHSGGAQGKMKGIQWIGGFLCRGCLQHICMKGNKEIQRKTQMEVGNAGLIHKRGCRIKGFP